MDSSANFDITLTINKGRGYIPAEENRDLNADVTVIPIDSIFTPIRNVKYTVENFRVEQKTDYEKLIIEVTTDGSIHPKDALKDTARLFPSCVYNYRTGKEENFLEKDFRREDVSENRRILLSTSKQPMEPSPCFTPASSTS